VVGQRYANRASAWVWLVLSLAWLGLFLARLTAPSDLLDSSQDRQAGYLQDLLCNGHLACQVDQNGAICTKPPLFTWLAGLLSLPFGRPTELGLFLPGALAVLGTTWLLWWAGRRWLGEWAGGIAAAALLLSAFGCHFIVLGRADSLYMLLVGGAGVAAFAAWTERASWLWFWLLAAAATLTKGPQGMLPVAAALAVCAVWERREPHPCTVTWGWSGWVGLALFLGLVLGWLAWAMTGFGGEVMRRMLHDELLGHAVNSKGRGEPIWQTCHKPIAWLLPRFAPWSAAAGIAVWRACRRRGLETCRFSRFCAAWLLAGLLMFSLASHKRMDLLSILLPATAWLAGYELAGWKERLAWPARWVLWVLAAGWLAVLGVTFGYYHSRSYAARPVVLQTRAIRQMAAAFEARMGRSAELLYVGGWGEPEEKVRTQSPQAFQFYLGTLRPTQPLEAIVARFSGPEPALAAVGNLEAFREELAKTGAPCYVLLPWPDARVPALLNIVANRPPQAIGWPGVPSGATATAGAASAGGRPTDDRGHRDAGARAGQGSAGALEGTSAGDVSGGERSQ
jgi:hypothetical protein